MNKQNVKKHQFAHQGKNNCERKAHVVMLATGVPNCSSIGYKAENIDHLQIDPHLSKLPCNIINFTGVLREDDHNV